MPKTKQGVFKGIPKEHRRLRKAYKNIIDEYNEDPSSIDFFSELAYSSDALRNELRQLASDVHGIIKSTAMEMEETKDTYTDIEKIAISHIDEVTKLYRQRVEDIRQSGEYLSDAEQVTLDKLLI